MVFSKIFENLFKSQNTDYRSDNEKKNKVAINQLEQGLIYLNNKKSAFNSLKKTSILLEQFDTSKLNDVSEKEKELLEKLKNEYNSKLSSYGQNYKQFMEQYYSSVEQVRECKADCMKRHKPGTSEWSYSRTACKAGCDFKGPYVSQGKDTYLGNKNTGEMCDQITKNLCQNRNPMLGKNDEVEDPSTADKNGTTIGQGCYECGGGIGGPPSAEINANKVFSCDDVPKALGYGPGKGLFARDRCYQARIASPEKNKNLWKEYQKLTDDNKELIKLAQDIFDKIKKLQTTDDNINSKIKDEENHLKKQLALYENVYANIQGYDKSKQITIEGQVEDVLLKEKAQSLHALIWLSLAILTFSLVIHRMRK